MANSYPPVLDSKMNAIPYIAAPTAADTFDIYFSSPAQNDIDTVMAGHLQLIIKQSSDNSVAVNDLYTPGDGVIYFRPSGYLIPDVLPPGGVYAGAVTNMPGIWKLTLPYTVFKYGKPQMATNYYI